MPILENQRHELFAQELAKGKTAHEAYSLAGFKKSRKNASCLRANEDITARVAELQAVAARSAEITIEACCAELDQAIEIAKANGQATALVSATQLRAKLGGLLIQKIEQKVEIAASCPESWAEIADGMLEDLGPLDEEDQQGLIVILRRFSDEIDDYKAAIKARIEAIKYADDPVELRHRLKLAAERQRQREQRLIASPH